MSPSKSSFLRATATAAVLTLMLAMPLRSAPSAPDLDGDGIPNIVDPDIDNDGIPNALDDNVDGGVAKTGPFAGKYIGDHLNNDNPAEKDIDGDALADDSLAEHDIDGDGKTNNDTIELDIDGDGRADDAASEKDIDGDGRNDDDLNEDDIDGDGYDDDDAAEMDIDGDGRNNGNVDEIDTDGDGINDDMDDDSDGDGWSNADDDDDNNDGVEDDDDGSPDRPGEQKLTNQLTRTANAPASATAKAQIHLRSTGSAKFEVEVEHFAPGSYELIVGGIPRGVILIAAGESDGQIEFDTAPHDPGEMLLDFNPAGQTLSLLSGAIEHFTGQAPTPGAAEQSWESNLTRSSASAPDAEGKLKYSLTASGVASLTIELQNLVAGVYDVKIAGVIRGQVTMALHENTVEGQLKFIPNPNDPDEALLDFDAAHQPVIIEQSGVTHLSGIISGPL